MSRDIDKIRKVFSQAHPSTEIEQLTVVHVADDDGLWFFRFGGVEVQLESTTGNCPFLIESDSHNHKVWGYSVQEVVQILAAELGFQKPR